MSRHIDATKDWDQLTEEDQQYLNERSHLKAEYFRARKHMERGTRRGGQETLVEDGKRRARSEDAEVTPEQWVEEANKEQIVAELENRGIDYDPRARKDALAKLLLSHVNNEN